MYHCGWKLEAFSEIAKSLWVKAPKEQKSAAEIVRAGWESDANIPKVGWLITARAIDEEMAAGRTLEGFLELARTTFQEVDEAWKTNESEKKEDAE
jgi:hypothetical protein